MRSYFMYLKVKFQWTIIENICIKFQIRIPLFAIKLLYLYHILFLKT